MGRLEPDQVSAKEPLAGLDRTLEGFDRGEPARDHMQLIGAICVRHRT